MATYAYLKKRHQTWYFRIKIPTELQPHFPKKEHVQSLGTRDLDVAKAKRWPLRTIWEKKFERARKGYSEDKREPHAIYQEALEHYSEPDFVAYEGDHSSVELAASLEFDKIEAEAMKRPDFDPSGPLPVDIRAQVDAINDTVSKSQGKAPEDRSEYAEPFSKTANKWFKAWLRDHKESDKAPHRDGTSTNTAKQYEAIIRLFTLFWHDRPLGKASHKDAAAYVDFLRELNPNWGRKGDAKTITLDELKARYGNDDKGMAARTINRHTNVMKSIWKWAKKREIVSGDNPFDDLHIKAKSASYMPWTTDELRKLSDPAPQRRDVYEVFLVGLYTGMRINEICSMTWGDLKDKQGVWHFDIPAAKSEAGVRKVPLHDELQWLLEKDRSDHTDRIWPDFSLRKASNGKPGEHASTLFGKHKKTHGFTSRTKVFHSLRKNITKVAMQAMIPENIWKQIIGHDRGLTAGTYDPDGVDLKLLNEIMGRIHYDGLCLPTPEEVYGGDRKLPHGHVQRVLRQKEVAIA